jgi:peroxiredoxin Q/BCP
MPVAVGQPAPDFSLPATGGRQLTLSALRGRIVVLYFYPRDSTPGCTREGQDFRDHAPAFSRHDAVILGVSRDSLRSHENFRAREAFPFDLLSDTEETACRAYDVIREKMLYGKKVLGVERSTFLIDQKGVLSREWRQVKVPGHVDEVLSAVTALAAR